jgi:hypothetical protein
MATNCSTCNNCKDECQCIPKGVTTPSYCVSDTPLCPEPTPCTETFDSNCIVYTGQGNECVGIENGDTVQQIIDNIAGKLENLLCINCVDVVIPTDNSANIDLNPTLGWSPVANATGYDVYFSTNQAFVNTQNPSVLVSSNQPTTNYTITVALNLSTIYYWKVVPRTSLGAVANCPTYRFTTVAENCVNPVKYILEKSISFTCVYDMTDYAEYFDQDCVLKMTIVIDGVTYTYNPVTTYIQDFIAYLNDLGLGYFNYDSGTFELAVIGINDYGNMTLFTKPGICQERGPSFVIPKSCTFDIKTITDNLDAGIFISSGSCNLCCPDCETTNRYVLSSVDTYLELYNFLYVDQFYCPEPCCINVSASATKYINYTQTVTLPIPSCPCGTDFSNCIAGLQQLLGPAWSGVNSIGIVEESTIGDNSTLCILKNLLQDLPTFLTISDLNILLVTILNTGIVVECSDAGILITSVKSYTEIKQAQGSCAGSLDCVSVTFTNTLPEIPPTPGISITYDDCYSGPGQSLDIAGGASFTVCAINNSWTTNPNISVTINGDCNTCYTVELTNSTGFPVSIDYTDCSGQPATQPLSPLDADSICAINNSWGTLPSGVTVTSLTPGCTP